MSTPVDMWRPGMDITGGRLQYMLERLNTSSTVNVETFGAVGNGVTDDTLAIQAAFDLAKASGGGLVQFTPGKTYAVSNFLVVYDYTTVYAYGATIKAIGNTGLLRNFLGAETFNAYGGHSNIQVLGGRWDGNAFNGTTGSVTAETDVMNFVHASNITVRDATIENTSTAHALEFNAIDGGRALNCRFLGFADNSAGAVRQFSEAVQIDISASGSSSIGAFDNTPAKNILVDGCYFGVSARCGKFGRAVGSHTLASGQYFIGIQIVNNVIDGTIQEGIRGYGWRRAIIANNIVNSTGKSGIMVTTPDPASAGYSANPQNITIIGNTITRPTDSGIRVLGFSGATCDQVAITGNSILGNAADSSNGIHVEYCSRPTVNANTLSAVNGTGIFNTNSDGGSVSGNTVRSSGSNGINVSASTGTVVSGNNVDGVSTNHCIFVTTSNDFLVTGNKVTNASATGAGIRLSASATDGTVAGNRIVKGTSQNGVTGDSTATACIVANNDLSGNGWTTAVAISMAASTTFSFGGGTTSPGFNRIS